MKNSSIYGLKSAIPEAPEIRIMSEGLSKQLIGKKCLRVAIMEKYKKAYENGLYSSPPLNYQQGSEYKWVDINATLSRMSTRGKKIIFEFNDVPNSIFRFISGCGMDGRWSWQMTKYTCIIVMFEDVYAFYEEIRIGGNFSICQYPSGEYNFIFKDVGPDFFTNDVTFEVYLMAVRRKRIQHMTIGEFMMEQKYISGFGNYLRAEVLYRARISPFRKLSELTDNDVYSIVYHGKLTFIESYEKNGLTIQSYSNIDGQPGLYKCLCYGRNFDDFMNPIDTVLDRHDRRIHYCKVLQV